MKYYDLNGKKIEDFSSFDIVLFDGERSSIITDGLETFKQYKKMEKSYNKLDIDLFLLLTSIKASNFVELHEAYFNSYTKYITHKINVKSTIDAYKSKYYEATRKSILESDMEYLLDNIDRIERLFSLFVEYDIKIDDVHAHNTVLTDDNIVIIDPDRFKFFKNDLRVLKMDFIRYNKKVLLDLLAELFEEDSLKYDVSYYDIVDLFNLKIKEDTCVAHTLSKKLKQYSKPIDYFYKKKK